MSEEIEIPVVENKLRRLELIAIILAAIALVFDVGWSFFVERPAREAERIANQLDREDSSFIRMVNAWQFLGNKDFGSTGHDLAIEYLATQGDEITGLDIACESYGYELGLTRDRGDYSSCSKILRFTDLELNSDSSRKLTLNGPSFSGVVFLRLNAVNTAFTGGNLELAQFRMSDLRNSKYEWSNLNRIDFTDSDLGNANFYTPKSFDKIYMTRNDMNNVSMSFSAATEGTVVFYANNLSDITVASLGNVILDFKGSGNWIWSDSRSLKEVGEKGRTSSDMSKSIANGKIRICDAKLRDFMEQYPDNFKYPHALPVGCGKWQWSDMPQLNPTIKNILSCSPENRESFYLNLTQVKRDKFDVEPPNGCAP